MVGGGREGGTWEALWEGYIQMADPKMETTSPTGDPVGGILQRHVASAGLASLDGLGVASGGWTGRDAPVLLKVTHSPARRKYAELSPMSQ